jgi:hypothetical protein
MWMEEKFGGLVNFIGTGIPCVAGVVPCGGGWKGRRVGD